MYEKEAYDSETNSRIPTLEEFAKSKVTQKICLYGDMLRALHTTSSSSSITTTIKECNSDEETATDLLDLLSEKLSHHELYTCTIPEGSFVHLGTTKELANFLTMGAASATTAKTNDDNGGEEMKRYQHLGRALGLTRRADSFVSGFTSKDNAGDDNIVINSVLYSKAVHSDESALGRLSVVEHCHIECDGVIDIGKQVILSGIRGLVKGDSFTVPNGVCLQLLRLRHEEGQCCEVGGSLIDTTEEKEMDHPSFVCICTGVEDDIKDVPSKSLYGTKFITLLGLISEEDLWDSSIPPSKRMLWNAKINPVLSPDKDGKLDFSFLDWVAFVVENGESDGKTTALCPTSPAMIGLQQWKDATRLSLSQIRKCVDSEAEARYRSEISSITYEESRLVEVSDILLNRRNEPCNFDYLVDSFSTSNYYMEGLTRALHALDTVISRALHEGHFDIVGRSYSTMALLIQDTVAQRGDNNTTSSLATDDTISAFTKQTIDGLKASHISQDTIASIQSIRSTLLASSRVNGSFHMIEFLEKVSSIMTERCVSGKMIEGETSSLDRTVPIPIGDAAIASAPARIDLAGGWSDTPPISFEHGGSVACLAVLIDGKRPLRAQCRMIIGASGIKLRTESRDLLNDTLLNSADAIIHTVGDLADYNNPMSDCALVKCTLIQLGLVSLESICEGDSTSIQPHLKKFCQTDEDVCLEIVSTSLLPTGSGMGSSSILAGCIIASIAKCVGILLTGVDDVDTAQIQVNHSNSLIHAVMMVEQLLTTGGGWQDQVGGLIGGLKLGSSDAHVLPLQTKVQRFDLPPPLIDELNKRLVLAFSGKPRLAKNILLGVLRRWVRRSEEIMHTVDGLAKGSSDAISCIQAGDLDGLGCLISQYWQYKIAMAGTDSGVEPDAVHSMLELLSSSGDIVGGSLCGAGGGGFLAMLASKGKSSRDVEATVAKASSNLGLGSFTWHACTVSDDGLVVNVET